MLTRGQKISITRKKRFELGIDKPICYWKGKKRSEETKEKIRQKLKLKPPIGEEHRKNISIALKKAYKEGMHKIIHNTGRTRIKKGNIPWNKGLKGIHLSPASEFKKGQMIKDKNVNWKNGITKVNRLIREMPEFKKWIKEIFKRDDYTCQNCKEKEKVSGKLHSHHIKELFKIIEENNIKTTKDARGCNLLWDISNGITYCKNCHFRKHGILKKTVNSGEAQTDKAVGNPELSLDSNILESATTRERVLNGQ